MRAFLTVFFASLLACGAISMLPTDDKVGSAFSDVDPADTSVVLADSN